MMTKKQILTHVEMEKDIIHALKNLPSMSEVSYKKWTIVAIIIAAVLAVTEMLYPMFVLWALLALTVFLIGNSIFNHIRLKNRIKNVSIHDYCVTREVVHHVDEEHYRAERGGKRRRTERISNYIVYFENGKSWHIPPKENYAWSERFRMQALGVYNMTHRGDVMIVVTAKQTGEVVAAYHSDLFEYKN